MADSVPHKYDPTSKLESIAKKKTRKKAKSSRLAESANIINKTLTKPLLEVKIDFLWALANLSDHLEDQALGLLILN